MRLFTKTYFNYALNALLIAGLTFVSGQAWAVVSGSETINKDNIAPFALQPKDTFADKPAYDDLLSASPCTPTKSLTRVEKPTFDGPAFEVKICTKGSEPGKVLVFQKEFTIKSAAESNLVGRFASNANIELRSITKAPIVELPVGEEDSDVEDSDVEIPYTLTEELVTASGHFAIAVQNTISDEISSTDTIATPAEIASIKFLKKTDKFVGGITYVVFYGVADSDTATDYDSAIVDTESESADENKGVIENNTHLMFNKSVIAPAHGTGSEKLRPTALKAYDYSPSVDENFAAMPLPIPAFTATGAGSGTTYVFKQTFTLPKALEGKVLGDDSTENFQVQAYKNGTGDSDKEEYTLVHTVSPENEKAWVTKKDETPALEATAVLVGGQYDLYYTIKDSTTANVFDTEAGGGTITNATRIIYDNVPFSSAANEYFAPRESQPLLTETNLTSITKFETVSTAIKLSTADDHFGENSTEPALDKPFEKDYEQYETVFLNFPASHGLDGDTVILKQTFIATDEMNDSLIMAIYPDDEQPPLSVQTVLEKKDDEGTDALITRLTPVVTLVGSGAHDKVRIISTIKDLEINEYLLTYLQDITPPVDATPSEDTTPLEKEEKMVLAATKLEGGKSYTVYYAVIPKTTAEFKNATRIVVLGEKIDNPLDDPANPTTPKDDEEADAMIPKAQKYADVNPINAGNILDFTKLTQDQLNKASDKAYPSAGSRTVQQIVRVVLAGITPDQPQVLNLSFRHKGAPVTVNGSALKFEKLIEGKALAFTLVNTKPDINDADGKFWLVHADGSIIDFVKTPMTLYGGGLYTIAFAILDRSYTSGNFDEDTSFDQNPAQGEIFDPARITTAVAAGSGSSGEESGGCTVGTSPNYDLALMVLAIIGVSSARSARSVCPSKRRA